MPSRAFMRLLLVVWLVVGAVACGSRDDNLQSRGSQPRPASATAAGAATGDEAAATTNREPRNNSEPLIVVLGDSLTAGLGLPLGEAFPSLLQQRLDAEGLKYQV